MTLLRALVATRRRVVLIAAIAALAAGSVAFAYWTAETGSGGSGGATAASVNQGATPTPVAQAGRKVAVSWGAATLSNGHAVDGYIVKRYDAGTDALASTLSSCSGTVAALSCTENNVPAGSWKYTVTPKIGDNWLGQESDKSGAVSVGAATLSLTKTLLGSADFSGGNATLTGTLSGFSDGEGISFHFDSPSGTTLSGTPSAADSSGGANVSITLPQPSDGAHTIYAVGNDASPSQASSAITVDTVAPTASASSSPTPTSSGWNSTSPVSVTLSADDGAGSGVDSIKYTTDGSDPKSSGTDYTTPISVSSTTTIKYFARDVAGNETSVQSYDVKIDTTAPIAGTLNITESNAFTYVSGTQVFYNPSGSNSGAFSVAASSSDAQSGIDKVNFPTFSGATGGGDDSSSPYQANYSWTSSFADAGSQTVTAYNQAGLTDTTSFTLTQDTTAPSVPAPDVTSGYFTSADVPVTLGTATDGGSGVNSGSIIVPRDDVALTGGNCDFSTGVTTTNVTLSPTGHDTTVQSGHCYRYREQATDNVGNQSTSSNSNVAKVDTSGPTVPAVTITPSGANTSVTGTTVFYNPSNSNTGGFTVTDAPTDGQSGINKVGFPDLSAGGISGGGDDSTSPYQGTYSWTSSSTTSGSQTVTAYNNAGGTNTTSFTVTPDTTGPTGGVLSVNATPGTSAGATATMSSGNIVLTTRTNFSGDAGSGFASSTLTQRIGTLSNNGCSYSASPTSVTQTSGQTLLTAPATGCYLYTMTGTDNVGNQSVLTTTVKVDTSAPTFGSPALNITAGNASFVSASGTTVFYKGTPASQGSFSVTANPVDADSGITKVTFPSPANFAGGGDDPSSPYATTYTWTTASAGGAQNVTATNGVGTNSANSPFTLTLDNNGPTGGAFNVNGVAASATGSTSYSKNASFPFATRTDYAADGPGSGVASSVLTMRTGDFDPASNSCSNFGTPTTITGNPAQTATDNHCYEYTLTGTDNVGNTSSVKSTVIDDQTSPTVTGLQLKNNGTTAGKLESGDQIVITYSEHLKPSTICGQLNATDTADSSADKNTVVNVGDNTATGGNDAITFTGTGCIPNLGSINLGSANYVTGGSATYSGNPAANATVVAWDPATRTVTVTLGNTKGGAGTLGTVASSTPSITPSASAQDFATNGVSTTVFTAAAGQQF